MNTDIKHKIYPDTALENIVNALRVAKALEEGKEYYINTFYLEITGTKDRIFIDEFAELGKAIEEVPVGDWWIDFISENECFRKRGCIEQMGTNGWKEAFRQKFIIAILKGIITFAENKEGDIMTSSFEMIERAVG